MSTALRCVGEESWILVSLADGCAISFTTRLYAALMSCVATLAIAYSGMFGGA